MDTSSAAQVSSELARKPQWYQKCFEFFFEDLKALRADIDSEILQKVFVVFVTCLDRAETATTAKTQKEDSASNKTSVEVKTETVDESTTADGNQLSTAADLCHSSEVPEEPNLFDFLATELREAVETESSEEVTDSSFLPVRKRTGRKRRTDKEEEEKEEEPEPDRKPSRSKRAEDLSCEECGKRYNNRSSLHRHKTYKHNSTVKCPTCGETVPLSYLEGHMADHEKTPVIQCKDCGKSFLNKRNLSNHIQRHHKPQNWVICDVCGKSVYRYFMDKHMDVHRAKTTDQSEGEAEHVCTICNKSYATQQRLYMHNAWKHKTSALVCSICGQAFKFKGKLKEHEASHTGEALYKCKICGAGFPRRRQIRLHEMKHNNDRRYKCPQCPKAFFTSVDLREHIYSHTGERPFACALCGLTYSSKGSKNTHMRIKHKNVSNSVSRAFVNPGDRSLGDSFNSLTVGSAGE
ncbi:unnamed protein product [Cyprideis torosa]|uniref:Uncharacterized protein n=1 Tax=Cyprideis torosa TaxID=163714 RepID=A0A7R8ZVJ8_9CRUS|nr:unnamed protein product [Cyprideis torosa]CAG0903425.1 unnamed protein product [Cyprideis torosa]